MRKRERERDMETGRHEEAERIGMGLNLKDWRFNVW